MVELSVQIGNENARAARRELKAFLLYVTDKAAGGRPDRHDTATQAYVTLRTILEKLDREIIRQDTQTAKQSQPPTPREPTIRERRGR